MDELAAKIGMDPLEFRMKNDPSAVRREEFRIGAEKIGWKDRDARRQTTDPAIRRGVGVGAAVWYNTGGTGPRATVTIHRDGSAEVEHGVQDLGTGSRTMVAHRRRRGARASRSRRSSVRDRRHAAALRPGLRRLDDDALERADDPRGGLAGEARSSPSARPRMEGPGRIRRPWPTAGCPAPGDAEARRRPGPRPASSCRARASPRRPSAPRTTRTPGSASRRARSSPRSRSTPRPAWSGSSGSSPSTTAALVVNALTDGEPDPGRRHPGRLLRALREPDPRPARPAAWSTPTSSSTRSPGPSTFPRST